jgi:hypothetical protein
MPVSCRLKQFFLPCTALCCLVLLQVSAMCQLLAEVQHLQQLTKQQLQTISRSSIDELSLQAKQLHGKLQQHIKHLQASNPLYQQIPYLGAGMEQQDCAVPAAAWQRDASKQPRDSLQDDHPLLQSSICSHEVLIDDEQLEQLQLAFAQLDSMMPDTAALEKHSEMISRVETVLQFNIQRSSWIRAIEVCQQLLAAQIAGAPAEQPESQQLAMELAALCTVLSPNHLAMQLQQYNLRCKSGSSILPPAFLHQVMSGFAAFKRHHFVHGQSQHLMGPAEVAEACWRLQEVADGNSSIAAMGEKLIGQFELLQMLYRQSAALTDTISSGTTSCSAVLEPMAFTLLDAVVLVDAGDVDLLLKLVGCSSVVMEQQRKEASAACSPASNQQYPWGSDVSLCVASFEYAAADHHQSALNVFQTSCWLKQWQQGVQAVHAVASATSVDSSSLPSQLAAAVAVAAACAAASGCCGSAIQQLKQYAAVRMSCTVMGKNKEELGAIETARRAAESAVAELRRSKYAYDVTHTVCMAAAASCMIVSTPI